MATAAILLQSGGLILFLSNLFLDVCDCYVSCYNLSLLVYTNRPVLVLLEFRNTGNNPTMSLNRELDQLVSEFSMEILIFCLVCRLRYPCTARTKIKQVSCGFDQSYGSSCLGPVGP